MMNKYEPLHAFVASGLTRIFREPCGLLRHPYIDPGGPYGTNLWDWDSYWSLKAALGLASDTGHDPAWRAQVIRHATGVLNNFFEHQGEDGSVPILMTPEDADWFDSTTDPTQNMAKPVFGQLMRDLAVVYDNVHDLVRWCMRLDKYYQCFVERYQDESGLFVWANDVAIGSDDDPTTWGRPPFSSANLLLNNLLYADLRAAAEVAGRVEQVAFQEKWNQIADALSARIQEYMWDERDGFFYSVDVQCRQRPLLHRHFGVLNENLVPAWSCLPLKVLYWTGFLPMWTGIATPSQAERMVRQHLLKEHRFWAPHGVRTLSADERMYDPASVRGNPSNWCGPIWIVSNYLVWEGLRAYGFGGEADALSERTLALLDQTLREEGQGYENFHPDTGQGLAGPGFISWNVLVHFMLADRSSE